MWKIWIMNECYHMGKLKMYEPWVSNNLVGTVGVYVWLQPWRQQEGACCWGKDVGSPTFHLLKSPDTLSLPEVTSLPVVVSSGASFCYTLISYATVSECTFYVWPTLRDILMKCFGKRLVGKKVSYFLSWSIFWRTAVVLEWSFSQKCGCYFKSMCEVLLNSCREQLSNFWSSLTFLSQFYFPSHSLPLGFLFFPLGHSLPPPLLALLICCLLIIPASFPKLLLPLLQYLP